MDILGPFHCLSGFTALLVVSLETVSPAAPPLIPNDTAAGPITLLLLIAILFAAALILALIATAIVAVLLLAGVASSSFLIAWKNRSARTGFRAAFLQCSAAAGIPIGIVSFQLASWIMHLIVSTRSIIVLGTITGAAGGASVGLLLLLGIRIIAKRLNPRPQQGFPL